MKCVLDGRDEVVRRIAPYNFADGRAGTTQHDANRPGPLVSIGEKAATWSSEPKDQAQDTCSSNCPKVPGSPMTVWRIRWIVGPFSNSPGSVPRSVRKRSSVLGTQALQQSTTSVARVPSPVLIFPRLKKTACSKFTAYSSARGISLFFQHKTKQTTTPWPIPLLVVWVGTAQRVPDTPTVGCCGVPCIDVGAKKASFSVNAATFFNHLSDFSVD